MLTAGKIRTYCTAQNGPYGRTDALVGLVVSDSIAQGTA
jgi:hypothetical protein